MLKSITGWLAKVFVGDPPQEIEVEEVTNVDAIPDLRDYQWPEGTIRLRENDFIDLTAEVLEVRPNRYAEITEQLNEAQRFWEDLDLEHFEGMEVEEIPEIDLDDIQWAEVMEEYYPSKGPTHNWMREGF